MKQNYNVGVRSTTVENFISNELNNTAKTAKKKKTTTKTSTEKKLTKFEIKAVVKELKQQALNNLNKKELAPKDLNELSRAILNIMEIQSYYPDKFKD